MKGKGALLNSPIFNGFAFCHSRLWSTMLHSLGVTCYFKGAIMKYKVYTSFSLVTSKPRSATLSLLQVLREVRIITSDKLG